MTTFRYFFYNWRFIAGISLAGLVLSLILPTHPFVQALGVVGVGILLRDGLFRKFVVDPILLWFRKELRSAIRDELNHKRD